MSILNINRTSNPNHQLSVNNHCLRLSGLLIGIMLPSTLAISPAGAVRVSDGRTFFNNPPRLIRAVSDSNSDSIQRATYQFTLRIPEDAGEPLQSVKIAQRPNVGTVKFRPNQTQAFKGNSAGGPKLSLVNSDGSQSAAGEELIVFNTPIPPGNTVTIALKGPTPRQGGVYLFGVTAFPGGEKGQGQFLGYGRLHFYEN